ncbi:glycoside hydrolase family 15 protein [soil metagenome]
MRRMTEPDDTGAPPPPRLLIEDHGLIGNTFSCALVDCRGSMNWMCLPRFDSPALFARLLGNEDNGVWEMTAVDPAARVTRRYRAHTAILETTFETDAGAATVIDFMPGPDSDQLNSVIRIVHGIRGSIRMRTLVKFRFDYGQRVPWLHSTDDGLTAIAGPDAVRLVTPVELVNRDMATIAEFEVGKGDEVPFELTWHASHLAPPAVMNPKAALRKTEKAWLEWSAQGTQDGPYADSIERSLITLKLLTYSPTGGIVAAPTTSLPEAIGGVRNWDYRYCWVRDAAFTLVAFLSCGLRTEARAFRGWLQRAIAGTPGDLQIMYGLHGERQLTEYLLDWLPGYENSQPVRVGNGAHTQTQLDVYGELTGAFHAGSQYGIDGIEEAWTMQKLLMQSLAEQWEKTDEGIWEIRGAPRHFVHSKFMAWSAIDLSIKMAESCRLEAPLAEWCALRDRIHADVCEKGFSVERNSFVQSYGSKEVDAALLTMVNVGFLPPDDPRIAGTIEAIERDLLVDGYVMRYREASGVDGLPPGEGSFLVCSFWLCEAYVYVGRLDDARLLFERLLAIRNDLGLMAEQYEPRAKRQLGNFPQAFSHVGLINAAMALARSGPVKV